MQHNMDDEGLNWAKKEIPQLLLSLIDANDYLDNNPEEVPTDELVYLFGMYTFVIEEQIPKYPSFDIEDVADGETFEFVMQTNELAEGIKQLREKISKMIQERAGMI